MRNLYLFLLCALPYFTQAQITLTGSDMPQVGDVYSSIDCAVTAGLSIGSAGSNQTYDFGMLTPVDTFTTNYIAASGTAGASNFPNATLADEDEGNFIYYQLTSNGFFVLGAYIDTSSNNAGQYQALNYNPIQKVFEIPTTYNTSFTDVSGFSITLEDDSGFADSIRSTTTFEINSVIDGYGTVITPNGSFAGLRDKRIETTTSTTELFTAGMWVTFGTNTFIDTSYNWFANNSKGPLVSIEIENGAISDVSYSTLDIVVTTPSASFTSADLGGGDFSFTDNSSNNPTSWAWDFGDGNSSSVQNPTHTYSTPGTYNVCLTVTNSAGSDMICMDVEVSIVFAPDADFTFTVSNAVVDFADASSNSPTSWLWEFGDGNMSTDQNPQHTYATSNTYNVCLTATNSVGSGMTCKDVEITITMVSAPVAAFTFTASASGVVDFVDASTNTPTSWLWDLGDGNTSTDQNPQHTYATSGMYTVCLTATNSAGSNTVCETVDVIITSLNELGIEIKVDIFPNPTFDFVNILLQNQNREELNFQLMNSLGQSVLTLKVETIGSYLIDVKKLSTGMYYYNFIDSNGIVRKTGSLMKKDF